MVDLWLHCTGTTGRIAEALVKVVNDLGGAISLKVLIPPCAVAATLHDTPPA